MAQAEEFGFISVDAKRNVGELATAFDNAGLRVISLGKTIQRIREHNASIDIIHTEEFINNRHLSSMLGELRGSATDKAHEALIERECREIVAAHLAQHMSQSPAELARSGRSVIRAVGMNLMAPELVHENGKVVRVKRDKGGVELLEAAQEGFRFIFTDPEDYPNGSTMEHMLRRQRDSDVITDLVLGLNMQTSEYLDMYRRQVDNSVSLVGLIGRMEL